MNIKPGCGDIVKFRTERPNSTGITVGGFGEVEDIEKKSYKIRVLSCFGYKPGEIIDVPKYLGRKTKVEDFSRVGITEILLKRKTIL
ncbi:MAG: hypothetical protein GTN40_03320 [Candidatus Aenigmarchaeota archaeon]|nr:hypothetical protein [Candidatus Aenigmarchaeota archaeon]